MKKFTKLACSIFSVLVLMSLAGMASAEKASNSIEVKGKVIARSVGCSDPNHQDCGIQFLLEEKSTKNIYELELPEGHALQGAVGKEVRIRAELPVQAAARVQSGRERGKLTAPTLLETYPGPAANAQIAPAPEVASPSGAQSAPASMQMLSTLMLFADYSNYQWNQNTLNASVAKVFTASNNVNAAIQALTRGKYGLLAGNSSGGISHGRVVLTEATTFSTSKYSHEYAVKAAASSQGYDLNAYDRVMIFLPIGGFTAYGYFNSSVSVYSFGRNDKLETIAHELGHNFGFAHSNYLAPNAADGTSSTEYGDNTCVMGPSPSATESAPLNPIKQNRLGIHEDYAGSLMTLSGDATYDIHFNAIDLASSPGVVAVRYLHKEIGSWGPTNNYIGYIKNSNPYGRLWDNNLNHSICLYEELDRPYSHAASAIRHILFSPQTSFVKDNVEVTFEAYGPNKEYATVSFDMDDGNAKPVANAQSVNVGHNTPFVITLSGSDGDGDSLTYAKVTDPANGSLSGTAPNLTYTPTSNYFGSDSFVFKVDDGKISTFATISIVVNVAPVANNQSVSVFLNAAEPITLTATDGNSDSLTYGVVTNPSKGSLSGSAPNLIYTPNNGVSGSDSFTFNANDGQADSNIATVNLTISTTPNTPPIVNAGPDQTVAFVVGQQWTPAAMATAAWYDAIDAGSITLNGGAVSQWDDKSGNGYHAVQTDSRYQPVYTASDALYGDRPSVGTGGAYKFFNTPSYGAKRIYAVVYYGGGTEANWDANVFPTLVGGSSVINGGYVSSTWFSDDGKFNDLGTYRDGSTASDLTAFPMPATLWRFDSSTSKTQTWMILGGTMSYTSWNGAIGELVFTDGTESLETQQKIEGYLAQKWGLVTNLPANHPYRSTLPTDGTLVNLAGSVSDPEHSPTYVWTDTGTGTGTGTVTFLNASDLNTAVGFSEAGSYVLRLTANDGYDQSYDEVTIIVTAPSGYTVTYQGNGSDGGTVPVDSNNYSSGGTATVLGNTGSLVQTGFSFIGWNTAADGSGVSYSPADTFSITNDVSLQAQWAKNFANWGGGVAFANDANNDGVSNGMAWLLGAANPNVNALGLLPTLAMEEGSLIYSFTCRRIAYRGGATLMVQASDDVGMSDLWENREAVVPDSSALRGDLVFSVQPNSSNSELIDVRVSTEGALGPKLFMRLKAVP